MRLCIFCHSEISDEEAIPHEGGFGDWPTLIQYHCPHCAGNCSVTDCKKNDFRNDLLNIQILPSVIVTPSISRCLLAIDRYFAFLPCRVISGKRTIGDQMRLMTHKILNQGIDKLYPEWSENIGKPISIQMDLEGKPVYWWSRAWSQLLHRKDFIHPPLPAEMLFDLIQIEDKKIVNKKGHVYDVGPYYKGHAFDLTDGTDNGDLDKIGERLEYCMKKPDVWVRCYTIEINNQSVCVETIPMEKHG